MNRGMSVLKEREYFQLVPELSYWRDWLWFIMSLHDLSASGQSLTTSVPSPGNANPYNPWW